jgi:hypothetical protein
VQEQVELRGAGQYLHLSALLEQVLLPLRVAIQDMDTSLQVVGVLKVKA